jgi:translation elongation factor EF-Ts
MVKGKMGSYLQEIVLPKMAYVLSNSGTPVEQYWKEVEEELNRKITITNTYLWSCK